MAGSLEIVSEELFRKLAEAAPYRGEVIEPAERLRRLRVSVSLLRALCAVYEAQIGLAESERA